MGSGDAVDQWTPSPQTLMVDSDPTRLPLSVGEVQRTGRLPDELNEAPSCRFYPVWEDGGPLLTENQYFCDPHYFLGHLASGFDPVLDFGRLALIGVDQDGTVPLLHSLFFAPIGLYYTYQQNLS